MLGFRIFLIQTYSIRDVHYYNDCTSNTVEDYFDVPSVVKTPSIYGFSSDGWRFGNASSYSRIIGIEKLSDWFNVEFTITEMGSTNNNHLVHSIYSNGSTPNASVYYNPTTRTWQIGSSNVTQTLSMGTRVRIEWRSGTVKVYLNDVLLGTGTHSVTLPTQVEYHTGTNRYVCIKDLVIETL